MLRVVAVRVEPQAMTEARFADKLIFWRALNQGDELAVGFVELR